MCPHHTLDDGVVGNCFNVTSIVVKRQVPHPQVQVLDKSSLVDSDRMIQPASGLRFTQAPMLFGDEPTAVQQLHKVILQKKKKENRAAQMQTTVILIACN